MLAVIGCGNLNRRDDGVGAVVAQRVAQALPADRREQVAVFDAGTDGMGVMYRARGASELVVVDASSSGAPPGSIHEVPGALLESAPRASLTLHDFRWDHALYVGRRLYGDAFPQSRVFLIEAEDLSYGLELSASVERAAGRVTELVLAWIEERAARA
jgi:hydrogenase maturation protease